MIAKLRERWKIVVPVGLGAVAIGAYLAFGVFGFHLIFVDDEVDEAVPVFESGASASGLAVDDLSDETAAAMNDAMDEGGVEGEVTSAEAKPPMEAEVLTVLSGDFIDRSHPTSGIALVLNDGTDQRFLRFEDFETDNGPDLDVYLTTAAPDASPGEIGADFIDLGDLKGNVGPQNYEISPDVDLDEYSTVVIWCTRFSVVFGAAELAP